MTAEGLQAGIISVTGQNYGANLKDRLRQTVKISLRVMAFIGTVGTLVLTIFRYPLFKVFLPNDPSAWEFGAQYLFIMGVCQFFVAIETGAAGIFNGIGMINTPAFISISLNAVRIPIALLLMPYLNQMGVWWAMSISSILKGIVAAVKLRKVYKSKM